MEKIVIICPSMWPKMSLWGETQRMFYLAGDLSEQGYEITVIAPAYETGRIISDTREQKYKNIYLGHIKQAGRLQQELSSIQTGFLYKVRLLASGILNRFGEWFYGEQNIISTFKKDRWVDQYKNDICQIIKKEKADKVIISMPSFTFMKLGQAIRRACADVKLIYDYRDPWHLWRSKRNLAYYREKYYLRYADGIVGFSEMFRIDMIKKMKLDPAKIHTVYNGYSEKAWEKFEKRRKSVSEKEIPVPDDKMIITYTGTMSLTDKKSNYRNPANLIAVIRNMPGVELYLVGISKIAERIDEKNVHYIGEVTQQQSFLYMYRSDVLVSIHDAHDSSGKYLISGKFYDYMRSGKVILQIGSRNGIMSKFIDRFELGVVCENQTDKLQEVIMALYEKWKDGELVRKTDHMRDIGKFAREVQNEAYRQYIDSI